jgi:DNA-binding protein Fis
LTQTHGNQSRAAEVLGIHRNTLNRKIAIHKLNGHR